MVTAATAHAGTYLTGDFVTGERPYFYRKGIHELVPGGAAPLYGLTSRLREEKIAEDTFYWWVRGFPAQRGSVSGVYTDVAMSTAYDGTNYNGGAIADGNTFHVKVSAAVASEFKAGSVVALVDADNVDNITYNCQCLSVTFNGASSRLELQALEDDVAGATSLKNADTVVNIGSSYPERAQIPTSITYLPTRVYNYTQMFWESLDMSRKALTIDLRTGDKYKDQKTLCMLQHSLAIERAMIWGKRRTGNSPDNKDQKWTGGLEYFIRLYASENVSNFTTDTNFSGKAWTDQGGGNKWINTQLEKVFRNTASGMASDQRLAFCDNQVILAIQEIAENLGTINIQPGAKAWGLEVTKWFTPFGTLNIKTHPLFNHETALGGRKMIIFAPEHLRYIYNLDTVFCKDPQKKRWDEGGPNAIDGIVEGYKTECGIEMHFPELCSIMTGFGLPNSLA